MPAVPEQLDNPAWMTFAATAAGYTLIVGILFVVLFVVPWLVW
jgi:uncharacterized membrane protein YtjA (UPF0391 family)